MATELSEKAKKRWIERFNALRGERKLRYASDAHERFCRSKGKAALDRKPVFKTELVSLDYPRLEQRFYKPTPIDLARPVRWTPETENALEFRAFSHDLLDPVLRTMPGYVKAPISEAVDMGWYRDCLKYLRGLSQLDLICVVDYTFNGYKYTNNGWFNAVDNDRQRELDDIRWGGAMPFYRYANPLWVGLARLVVDGVDGSPFVDLDEKVICTKPANVRELTDVLTEYLATRKNEPGVALAVDNRLHDRLVNLATWKDVLKTIAALDERLTDLIFLLTSWVYKYLSLTFIAANVATRYRSDIRRIILEAPAVSREMIVYRGVSNDYYMPEYRPNRKRDVYHNHFTISTTIDPAVSMEFFRHMTSLFGEKTRDCCLKVIHVMPGTPALCVWPVAGEPSQAEVLLPEGTTYLVRSHRLRHLITEIPKFTQGKAVRGEVCWDKMIERKNKNGDPIFPRKWVTEIYVDGTAAALRHKRDRKRKRERSA